VTQKTGISGLFVPINRYFLVFVGFLAVFWRFFGDWHAYCIIYTQKQSYRGLTTNPAPGGQTRQKGKDYVNQYERVR
jgi:hypothetical protein